MKIGVMGAGAVGCFYGGMLARAGHEVVLIARPTHADAINRNGLFMETLTFSEHVRLVASIDPGALHGADVVLCCVKSGGSERAAADMAPYLAADTQLLSLQNGVDNAERLQRALGRPVLPSVVYVASEMAGPGHVRHHGRGELVIGESAGSAALQAVFAAAGVPVAISDNVAGALWVKLIANCAYNALSAITQQNYGRIVQGANVLAVMRDVVDECIAVAAADGIRLPGDPWQVVETIARTMPGQMSSTAQDLARHKRSEIDHLNGYVVERGTARGIPTPLNRALQAIVRLLEGR